VMHGYPRLASGTGRFSERARPESLTARGVSPSPRCRRESRWGWCRPTGSTRPGCPPRPRCGICRAV